jgi:hypothetical protein
MPSSLRKSHPKPLPWTEIGAVAVVAIGAAWGLTRQPLQPRPAQANTAVTPEVSSAALPGGPRPPPPSVPSEAQGCGYADRGLGDYEAVPVAMGQLLVRRAAVQESGSYRLLVHFHGAEAVKRLLAPEAWDMNLLLVDAGDGSSAYRQLVASTAIVDAMLESADRATSHHLGREAHADRLVVTSFSAGYGAVAGVLSRPDLRARVDGVILLDSLHAPYGPGGAEPDAGALAPFVAFARDARGGEVFMGISHTSIETHGYASTTESTRALLGDLHLAEEPVGWAGEQGLLPTSQLAEGRLLVRGYEGTTPEAHCAQLALLPGLLHELTRR